jgi:hypothetical protein
VVPVARLGEFEAAFARLGPEERGTGPWALSGLLGGDVAREVHAAAAFNQRLGGAAVIGSLEAKVESVQQVQAMGSAVPAGKRAAGQGAGFELFLELPLGQDLRRLAAAVRAAGARAKIRTGGVREPDIPPPERVLAFLEECSAIRLPFKATAGLHHPVRGPAPLTYEPGSACATMFGYLNVFLSAAALWTGRPRAEALALLTNEDRAALAFGDGEVRWGPSRFTAEELARVRSEFALSVGSCSFAEPVGEIRHLGARLDRKESAG